MMMTISLYKAIVLFVVVNSFQNPSWVLNQHLISENRFENRLVEVRTPFWWIRHRPHLDHQAVIAVPYEAITPHLRPHQVAVRLASHSRSTSARPRRPSEQYSIPLKRSSMGMSWASENVGPLSYQRSIMFVRSRWSTPTSCQGVESSVIHSFIFVVRNNPLVIKVREERSSLGRSIKCFWLVTFVDPLQFALFIVAFIQWWKWEKVEWEM